MVADNNINNSKNVKILIYDHDYNKKVYLTFSVRFGFAYRYISFSKSSVALEINQAFVNIFVNYIRLICKNVYNRDIYTNVYRGSFSISLISEIDNVNDDISWLYSIIYDTNVNSLLFNRAKIRFDEDFCGAYNLPINKAMYHMLEYSESNKKFDFYKFARDIRSFEVDTFKKYITIFIRPDNTLLTVAGRIETGSTLQIPEVSYRKVYTKSYALCYIKHDVYKSPLVAKKINASTEFSMGCIKFNFYNSDVDFVKKYLLLKIMADIVFMHCYEVNVDFADSTIIYWNYTNNKSDIKFNNYLLNDISVQASKARILSEIATEMNNNPVRFYQNWSNNYLYKINIDKFINEVSECSSSSLRLLYNQLRPVINEGEVILNPEVMAISSEIQAETV